METKNENVDFKFLNDEDQSMGVETAIYQNGNEARRVKLSTGKQAVIRELTGRDFAKIDNIIAKDPEKHIATMLHFAVKIDGASLAIEDYENMKGKDYNKLKIQLLALNF